MMLYIARLTASGTPRVRGSLVYIQPLLSLLPFERCVCTCIAGARTMVDFRLTTEREREKLQSRE